MRKIKTREKVKDVKVLDKSKVVGERMKNTFIRSKDHAKNLADDGQVTPSEYAEDQVQYAAEDISRNAAYATGSGVKAAGRKGKEVFQRHRAKTAEQKGGERAAQGEQRPTPDAGAPSEPRQRPRNLPQNTASAEQPSQGLRQTTAIPEQRPRSPQRSNLPRQYDGQVKPPNRPDGRCVDANCIRRSFSAP